MLSTNDNSPQSRRTHRPRQSSKTPKTDVPSLVEHLQELHRWQGILLNDLVKRVGRAVPVGRCAKKKSSR